MVACYRRNQTVQGLYFPISRRIHFLVLIAFVYSTADDNDDLPARSTYCIIIVVANCVYAGAIQGNVDLSQWLQIAVRILLQPCLWDFLTRSHEMVKSHHVDTVLRLISITCIRPLHINSLLGVIVNQLPLGACLSCRLWCHAQLHLLFNLWISFSVFFIQRST